MNSPYKTNVCKDEPNIFLHGNLGRYNNTEHKTGRHVT